MKRCRVVLPAMTCVLALLAARRVSGAPQTPAAASNPAPRAAVNRADGGDVTVRAFRVETLTIDGRLDESIYELVSGRGDFIEQEPREGVPATEQTDIWVLFNDKNLYISARCWDSHPEHEVANELRRDAQAITSNENLVVTLDTFRDRRNGFFFQTTPLGAMRDQAITGESPNDDWNTVWEVKTNRDDKGWTAEMMIPFKSLRYPGAGPQDWGINFRRIVKWKNEVSFLVKVAPQYGILGTNRLALAASLVGLETPAQSMNLELKPYAVSSVTTDRTAKIPFSNDVTADAGFDFKYGLTRGLIADVTVNTDFAQIEEDLQQVNLTRFSVFFPEKRDFFLEGQGIFAFGGVQFSNAVTAPGEVPVLFFSRRIGLNQNQSVPVVAGGRLTGKAGRFTIGALNIETGDKAAAGAVATNFTVARVKLDFLRRSNMGILVTRRSPTVAGSGSGTNLAIGADAALLLFKSVTINTFYARTQTPGVTTGTASYRGKYDYNSDRYGLTVEHLTVGEHFNPEVGFLRRSDFRRNFGQVRFSPRPKRDKIVRKLTWQAGLDYITNAQRTAVENREASGAFNMAFQNSDVLAFDYSREYELLPRNFTISPGIVVPAGGYVYHTSRLSYILGQQRMISGRVSAAQGTFYNGTKKEVTYSGRVALKPQFAIEPGVTLDWVDLPYGDFTARLVNARFVLTQNQRMAVSSLVQYNAVAHSLNSSIRLRWEYRGGSELFVVYSDGRDTAAPGVPDVLNRSFALKITRLLRF